MPVSANIEEGTSELEQWREAFATSKYGVIRHAISADAAEVASRYFQILHDYHEPLLLFDAEQQSFGRYNDPLGESVLASVTPTIRRLTGLDLLPTYSFTRMYRHGGSLAKHVDRPSCEVSGTLFLGSDAAWPICVDVSGDEREIALEPGDVMIYRGCEVPHWRRRFEGSYSVHVFLHFVESGGPHAHLAYDEREALGAPQRKAAPVRDQAGTGIPPGVIRRNEPCPCGSGRRFKNCHGSK